jgi:hypothetical protein
MTSPRVTSNARRPSRTLTSVHSDRFQYVSVKFEALDIGHATIISYIYRDIRDKGRRLPTKTV